MFGNVIYYDKNKIDEYRAVVKGQRNLQIDEYEVSNDKGVQIDLKAFGADAKASKTYRAMEEYEELEVTIIARITSSGMVKSQKAFYDPLKDFMTLNRVMRRSIEGRTDGLNEIYADKDYRTIEVLAIYQ